VTIKTRRALTSPICFCRGGEHRQKGNLLFICAVGIMCASVASRRVRDRDESARTRWRLMSRKPFSVAPVARVWIPIHFFFGAALSIYWAVKMISARVSALMRIRSDGRRYHLAPKADCLIYFVRSKIFLAARPHKMLFNQSVCRLRNL
jgi:hypothetical protein